MIIYKVTNLKEIKNLDVFIDNEKASVYPCYVSKYPINCRWPGHQREETQKEIAYFLSFESSKPVKIKIKRYKDGKALIRPLNKKVLINENSGIIEFELSNHGQYSFELGDYHKNIHIFFNKKKEYILDENTIVYKNGIYDVGEISLKSNQKLYIDKTAIVYGNIKIENQENIKIFGGGILDMSHEKEIILFEAKQNVEQIDANNALRKHFISIKNSKNIEIEDIILKDSLCYNIATLDCDSIKIDNVKLIGNWRFNSDGIDLQNTSNSIIKNSFIRTFDDCICIKGAKESGKSIENVTYDNLVLWCDWGHAFEIGYETCAKEIKNIIYKNSVAIRTSFDFINIGCVDYANIHNVKYENIDLEYTGDELTPFYQSKDNEEYVNLNKNYKPVTFSLGIFHHFEYSVGNEYGNIHDIEFENIRIFNIDKAICNINGADSEHKINNISFRNIYLNNNKIENLDEFLNECNNASNIEIK